MSDAVCRVQKVILMKNTLFNFASKRRAGRQSITAVTVACLCVDKFSHSHTHTHIHKTHEKLEKHFKKTHNKGTRYHGTWKMNVAYLAMCYVCTAKI